MNENYFMVSHIKISLHNSPNYDKVHRSPSKFIFPPLLSSHITNLFESMIQCINVCRWCLLLEKKESRVINLMNGYTISMNNFLNDYLLPNRQKYFISVMSNVLYTYYRRQDHSIYTIVIQLFVCLFLFVYDVTDVNVDSLHTSKYML